MLFKFNERLDLFFLNGREEGHVGKEQIILLIHPTRDPVTVLWQIFKKI